MQELKCINEYSHHVETFTLENTRFIKEASETACKILGVNFFCVNRLYNNGDFATLHADPKWINHFNQQGYAKQLFGVLKSFQTTPLKKPRLIFWGEYHQTKIDPIFEEILKDAIEYGIGPGCTLINPGPNYLDFLDFAPSLNDSSVLNRFLYLINYLNHFSFFMSKEIDKIILKNSDKLINIENFFLNTNDIFYKYNQEILDHSPTLTHESVTKSNKLTPRERSILQLLLLGKLNKQIAFELNLSVRTVESYLINLKNKFGCSSKNQLLQRLLILNP